MALMPRIDLVLTIGIYAQSWHMGTSRRPSLTQTVMDWRAIWDAPASPKCCCRIRRGATPAG